MGRGAGGLNDTDGALVQDERLGCVLPCFAGINMPLQAHRMLLCCIANAALIITAACVIHRRCIAISINATGVNGGVVRGCCDDWSKLGFIDGQLCLFLRQGTLEHIRAPLCNSCCMPFVCRAQECRCFRILLSNSSGQVGSAFPAGCEQRWYIVQLANTQLTFVQLNAPLQVPHICAQHVALRLCLGEPGQLSRDAISCTQRGHSHQCVPGQ